MSFGALLSSIRVDISIPAIDEMYREPQAKHCNLVATECDLNSVRSTVSASAMTSQNATDRKLSVKKMS